MIEDMTVPAKLYACEKCLTEWLSLTVQAPQFCRNLACRSRNWNGKKQLRRSHVNEILLPPPRTSGRPKTYATLDEGDDL
jgi:hypothetical protein